MWLFWEPRENLSLFSCIFVCIRAIMTYLPLSECKPKLCKVIQVYDLLFLYFLIIRALTFVWMCPVFGNVPLAINVHLNNFKHISAFRFLSLHCFETFALKKSVLDLWRSLWSSQVLMHKFVHKGIFTYFPL